MNLELILYALLKTFVETVNGTFEHMAIDFSGAIIGSHLTFVSTCNHESAHMCFTAQVSDCSLLEHLDLAESRKSRASMFTFRSPPDASLMRNLLNKSRGFSLDYWLFPAESKALSMDHLRLDSNLFLYKEIGNGTKWEITQFYAVKGVGKSSPLGTWSLGTGLELRGTDRLERRSNLSGVRYVS